MADTPMTIDEIISQMSTKKAALEALFASTDFDPTSTEGQTQLAAYGAFASALAAQSFQFDLDIARFPDQANIAYAEHGKDKVDAFLALRQYFFAVGQGLQPPQSVDKALEIAQLGNSIVDSSALLPSLDPAAQAQLNASILQVRNRIKALATGADLKLRRAEYVLSQLSPDNPHRAKLEDIIATRTGQLAGTLETPDSEKPVVISTASTPATDPIPLVEVASSTSSTTSSSAPSIVKPQEDFIKSLKPGEYIRTPIEVYVLQTNPGTFVISPKSQGVDQRIAVTIDAGEGSIEADKLLKEQQSSAAKVILGRDEAGNFVIKAAGHIGNPDAKITAYFDKGKGPELGEIGYNRDIKSAVKLHMRAVADRRVEAEQIEILRLDAQATQTALTEAGSLQHLVNHAAYGSMADILARLGITNEQVNEFYHQQIAGKSMAELLQCRLTKPLTVYQRDAQGKVMEDASGQPLTRQLTSLASNLIYSQKQEVTEEVRAALIENSDTQTALELLFNRSIQDSVAGLIAERASKVIDPDTEKPIDFIQYELRQMAAKGIIISPADAGLFFPGLSSAITKISAPEMAYEMAARSMSLLPRFLGAQGLNDGSLVDGVEKEMAKDDPNRNILAIQGDVDTAIAAIQARATFLENATNLNGTGEYPNDVYAKVKNYCIQNNIPDPKEAIAKKADAKASWQSFVLAVGPAIEAFEKSMSANESIGFF